MCKTTFLEKALPFPHIAFRFFSGGELKTFLPPSSLKERVLHAYPEHLNAAMLNEAAETFTDHTITLVAGRPELKRKDRKFIHVFVNNRRLNEYSLIQAVEYGYSGHLPGGNYPVAFVFININPELVDFNIHPAKKEARFRNLPEIHHNLAGMLKSYAASYALHVSIPGAGISSGINSLKDTCEKDSTAAETRPAFLPLNEALFNEIRNKNREIRQNLFQTEAEAKFKYFGQLFNLFLLAVLDDSLFIIDQHAAHERILYDQLIEKKSTPQNLLVPIQFELSSESEERILIDNQEKYRQLGITATPGKDGTWMLLSLPDYCLAQAVSVIEFIKSRRGPVEELQKELYATIACKAAVKDGEQLDDVTATRLITQTFALKNARCPHGRPVWYELSKKELFYWVGRL
ncbi:MAG: hypothetical protein AB1481_07425 [Candidatus Omnitrophota bacterium]